MMLGEILKKLRNEKQMTQNDLSKLLKIERSTYVKYETGNSSPDYDKLIKLAEIFDTSTDYLLGRTDIRTNSKTITLAAHRTDSYGNPLTEDEQQVVNNVIEAYRKSKQANKEEK